MFTAVWKVHFVKTNYFLTIFFKTDNRLFFITAINKRDVRWSVDPTKHSDKASCETVFLQQAFFKRVLSM